MPEPTPQEIQPVAALRQAALGRVVGFLRLHPITRGAVGAAGAALVLLGGLASPFREVPLLSWLTVGPVAAACLAGGLGALGVWFLSRPIAPAAPGTHAPAATATPPADLVDRLERLARLHSDGALTDEEFTRAKARLLP
jgi:hypothetical protein